MCRLLRQRVPKMDTRAVTFSSAFSTSEDRTMKSLFSYGLVVLCAILLASCSATTQADHLVVTSPVNQVCPILAGEAVDSELAVSFEGQRVAFCCRDCITEWESFSLEQKKASLMQAMPPK